MVAIKLLFSWAVLTTTLAIAKPTPQQSSAPIREIATKLTGFSIPFKLEQTKESYIEVQLYVSDDQGSHWNFYGRQDTDQGDFNFQSNGDGEYWFALKTLDRNRQLLPPGNIVAPELKITVDTIQPKLEFQIRPDAAGRIIVDAMCSAVVASMLIVIT